MKLCRTRTCKYYREDGTNGFFSASWNLSPAERAAAESFRSAVLTGRSPQIVFAREMGMQSKAERKL